MLVKDANYQKTENGICKMEERPNQNMLCLGQGWSRASLQSREREGKIWNQLAISPVRVNDKIELEES